MIIPLSDQRFDVNALRTTAGKVAGRACAQIKPLVLLNEIFGIDYGPDHPRAYREAGGRAQHIFQSFIVVCDAETVLDLIRSRCVAVDYIDTTRRGFALAVATGNLAEWRDLMVTSLVAATSPSFRALVCEFLEHFDSIGYAGVFSNYRRTGLSDGTLLLENKE